MDLIKINIDNFNIVTTISITLIIAIMLFFVLLYFINKKFFRYKKIEISEMELGIGNSKIILKANNEIKQIAYILWVELNTRKLAISFNENEDVIADLYASWYKFFGISRDILKTVPVSNLDKDTENLINIFLGVLNDVLRVHLSRWYSKYNTWYNSFSNDDNLTEQEIQKLYPQYETLISELIDTNRKLKNYSDILYEIIFK